jgi:hypothetical protein
MVELEGLLDKVDARPARSACDLDLDGHEEVFLQNGQLQAVVRLDGTASITEFDSYALRHNFGDTLTRQTEHYHRKVHATPEHESSGNGIANPHERMGSKHEISAADLATDDHARTLFHDAWQPNSEAPVHSVSYQAAEGKGKAATLAFAGVFDGYTVVKKITLVGKKLTVEYHFDPSTTGIFSVEINLAMPSCDGPAGRFRVGGHVPGGFGQPLHVERFNEILLEDEVLGGVVRLASGSQAKFDAAPHFSVSQSEAGFEKIMQAVTMRLSWDLRKTKGLVTVALEVN